jgi:hypothetical protein
LYAYSARGCGKREDYEGRCDVGGCLIEKRPSLAEQARIRAEINRERASSFGSPSSGSRKERRRTDSIAHLAQRLPHTVRLFFGSTPKFGSGTESSIFPNSTESHSMREGEMIWIVDQSGNGVSSLTASRDRTRVTITRSCSGFAVD